MSIRNKTFNRINRTKRTKRTTRTKKLKIQTGGHNNCKNIGKESIKVVAAHGKMVPSQSTQLPENVNVIFTVDPGRLLSESYRDQFDIYSILKKKKF